MNEQLTEKQISTELLFDGTVLHVYKDDVQLPDGGTAVRELIKHIGAVCVIPVTDDGRVVLERQYRYPISRVVIEIPAGKLDYAGEDRLSAAQRELSEETGFTAGRWTHLTDIVTTPGFCDEKIGLYLARDLTSGESHPDEDEFLNVVKLPLDEAVDAVMRGEITDAKTVCALLMAKRIIEKESR